MVKLQTNCITKPLFTQTVTSNTPVETRIKSVDLSKHSRIGVLNTRRNRRYHMKKDLIDILGTLTKKESAFFAELKRHMDWRTNKAELFVAGFTQTQRNTRSRLVVRLTKEDLIKPVRPGGYYMINPGLILPSLKYREVIEDEWESL